VATIRESPWFPSVLDHPATGFCGVSQRKEQSGPGCAHQVGKAAQRERDDADAVRRKAASRTEFDEGDELVQDQLGSKKISGLQRVVAGRE